MNKELEEVRGYARAGRVRLTGHARRDSMPKRNVSYEELEEALLNAKSCLPDRDGKWKVIGPDADGDDLTVIIVLDDGVRVVTVY